MCVCMYAWPRTLFNFVIVNCFILHFCRKTHVSQRKCRRWITRLTRRTEQLSFYASRWFVDIVLKRPLPLLTRFWYSLYVDISRLCSMCVVTSLLIDAWKHVMLCTDHWPEVVITCVLTKLLCRLCARVCFIWTFGLHAWIAEFCASFSHCSIRLLRL